MAFTMGAFAGFASTLTFTVFVIPFFTLLGAFFAAGARFVVVICQSHWPHS